MTLSIDTLRRSARQLRRAWEAGEPSAIERLKMHPPRDGGPRGHADFLHVIAQENNFASWPRLKLAAETMGLDRAARLQRLKVALSHGQGWVAQQLLAETPDLARGHFGLECALYDRAAVAAALSRDPTLATRQFGPRSPILHLAFSRWIHTRPELEADMLAVAELLLAHGADVNDGYATGPETDHRLSALYGALGHADNMVLARWLLDHGADPNDGESLYHSTELGHHKGLRMLLEAGADPAGTNALLRALDFNDHVAVRMLLEAGAKPAEFSADEVGGEAPMVIPALHQAARRMCDAEMVRLLLDHGADPALRHDGATAYGYARVFGNAALRQAIEVAGPVSELTREEALMARAAQGQDSPGAHIDPERLPPAYRNIIRDILHLPGKLDHIRRLVALGLEYDRPDVMGVTPVQAAGWEGLPDLLAYLISQRPDLGHVNNYGGTLLSTILHGSEACPQRAARDHVGCARIVLEHGLSLPRSVIRGAGEPGMAEFLADWAARYPGQVV